MADAGDRPRRRHWWPRQCRAADDPCAKLGGSLAACHSAMICQISSRFLVGDRFRAGRGRRAFGRWRRLANADGRWWRGDAGLNQPLLADSIRCCILATA